MDRPSRVLVVDDDPQLRRCVGHLLRRNAYEVLEAADGLEALNVLERYKGDVALVITDTRIPHMDGFRLEATVRALYPHVPVLFASSGCAAGQATEDIAADRILPKPFAAAELLKRVRKIMAA